MYNPLADFRGRGDCEGFGQDSEHVLVIEDIELPKALKRDKDLRTQYGALCYRMMRGKVQVLLITSRTRRRWIIPKGWPMNDRSPAEAASLEAWEEAGVSGKVSGDVVGYFTYTKYGDGGAPDLPCVVCVFPLKVKSLAKEFPERHERRRKWFSPKQASKKVAEPDLRQLLRDFKPPKS